jgi:3-isopropylmalate/(R)-2-methylmalate dehydratase small subunit
MKNFGGKILFLDRADINTDEIIPAKYLTEITKDALKPFALEDLKLPGFSTSMIEGKSVVITRSNFGCGSSREHAPWALEVNGINVAASESFARIFRQNMFNCGMMAVELPAADIDMLFKKYSGRDASAAFDLEKNTMTVSSGSDSDTVRYSISEYDKALVSAGGWIEFADKKY